MNLVPKAFQRKLLVRKRMRQWFTPCAMALMVSLVAVGEIGFRLRNLVIETAALEARLKPMNELSKDNDRIAAQLKSLVGHESVLNEIVGVQRPISLLAVISRSAAESNSRLQIRKLTVQQSASGTATMVKSSKPPEGGTPMAAETTATEITITGIALDDSDVAAFVQSLKTSRAFTAVELKSTTGTLVTDVAVRQYDVCCRR
ncbi:MAG TPA: PilN domain-containing protein [Caulifigura sp.]|jgi:Tfp pilus assembly protein PilN|nr:PilN domain-containing protein [Caulifigura sp.]